MSMKWPHPAYVYNLFYKLTQARLQQLIAAIEKDILTWNGLSAHEHTMGGIAFKYNRKEIGHVHWNGDLDIIFGPKLTGEILKIEAVKRHLFVPDVAVTFPIRCAEDLPFAIALLRLSYLLRLSNLTLIAPGTKDVINGEAVKLPGPLLSLFKTRPHV